MELNVLDENMKYKKFVINTKNRFKTYFFSIYSFQTNYGDFYL